jgi:hypothetical protein
LFAVEENDRENPTAVLLFVCFQKYCERQFLLYLKSILGLWVKSTKPQISED